MLEMVGLSILFLGSFTTTNADICPLHCSSLVESGSEICRNTTGECLHGCQLGYAGPSCSVQCPENCHSLDTNSTEICNSTTEECLFGCKLGYAGQNCSVECPITCSSSDTSTIGMRICDATSGECLFGCKDGSYGERCAKRCTDFDRLCAKCSSVDSGSPVCDKCHFGFYKMHDERCVACSYHCQFNLSSSLPQCRESDGYCNFGCKPGHYGFTCGAKCTLCNNTCHRDTGRCDACMIPNLCGPTCEVPCNDGCLSQKCEQSCTCSIRCTPKKWGEQCKKLCNENCDEPADATINICARSNGSCLHGCVNDMYWGSQCENTCSSACVGHVCDRTSGNCINGCNSTEVFGIGCDKACNKNCNNGTCFRADGYCDNGCIKGSYSEDCHLNCSINCRDNSCNRTNGYCEYGCSDGFHGKLCDKLCNPRCLNRKCDRKSGSCTCKKGFEGQRCEEAIRFADSDTIRQLAGLAVSGWLLFFVVSGAFIGMVVKRKKLFCQEKENDDQLEEINRNISHEYTTLQHETTFTHAATNYETLDSVKESVNGQKEQSSYENITQGQQSTKKQH